MVDPQKTGNSNCRWPRFGRDSADLPRLPGILIVGGREK
jgi:hypothetical protein